MSGQVDRFTQAMNRIRRIRFLFGASQMLPHGEFILLARMHELSGREDAGGTREVYVSNLRGPHMTLPAVSQQLSALERKGLVDRKISGHDRRRVAVTLTPEGERALDHAKGLADEWIDVLLKRFGEQNAETFLTLLDKLANTVDEIYLENIQSEKEESHCFD